MDIMKWDNKEFKNVLKKSQKNLKQKMRKNWWKPEKRIWNLLINSDNNSEYLTLMRTFDFIIINIIILIEK